MHLRPHDAFANFSRIFGLPLLDLIEFERLEQVVRFFSVPETDPA
jgi:hypothetical protein